MGTSTDGEICYGVFVGEETLPWQDEDDQDCDMDEEEWWRRETGFVRQHRELFTDVGSYIDGDKPPAADISDYYKEQRDWIEQHPLPFEMVNACSGDYPMWIFAVPGTLISASRGDPVSINLDSFDVPTEALKAFNQFVAKYGIEGDAGWWLSSYWG